jgi:glutamine amidotransferase
VQRTNCHPFAFENWLFQHNGMIPEFKKLKRKLVLDVDPELYPQIEGSTDSELLFFLALTLGLREDPQWALQHTIGHVERVRQQAGIQQPISFSAAVSDGKRLFAVRYSSNQASPTLFHSCHVHSLRTIHGCYESLPPKAVILVSEPLDELAEHWRAVPESSFVNVHGGEVSIVPFSINTNA